MGERGQFFVWSLGTGGGGFGISHFFNNEKVIKNETSVYNHTKMKTTDLVSSPKLIIFEPVYN